MVQWNKKRSPPFPFCPVSCLLADAIFLLAAVLNSDSKLFAKTFYVNQLTATVQYFSEFQIPLDNADFETEHKQGQRFSDNA